MVRVMSVPLCCRVSEAEAEAVRERAASEGLDVSELLRDALRSYLNPQKSFWRKQPEQAHPFPSIVPRDVSPKDCDHPESLRFQTGQGVFCDKCGGGL